MSLCRFNSKGWNFFLALFICLWTLVSSAIFNQSQGYRIDVDTSTWSNTGELGGCVPCPYTCIKPVLGSKDKPLDMKNATVADTIPAIYTVVQSNGCCYARKGKSKVDPSCENSANPPTAEDCGFLSGPTLSYTIKVKKTDPRANFPLKDPLLAILFASVDCENFWAVNFKYVRQASDATTVTGKQVMNKGCYGNPSGSPIVLAGCLTNSLKFDKSTTYSWKQLALKCRGLGGRCSRTNGLWGMNLKCCTDRFSLKAKWDLKYDVYVKASNLSEPLPGLAITAIVFGGVALMMLLVHLGSKLRRKAIATRLKREQETADDYDEIITPLNPIRQIAATNTRSTINVPASITVSLHQDDKIYRPPKEEVLFEGDLH